MKLREFITALTDLDKEGKGVNPFALDVQFNTKDGDTKDILSIYVAEHTVHIDIGEDN